MRTGTKIAIFFISWNQILVSFLLCYGLIKYGTTKEYWMYLAAIITAIEGMSALVYRFNEKRKEIENTKGVNISV